MAKTPERAAPGTAGWLAALRDPLRAVCLLLIGMSLCVSFARLLSVEPLQSANDRSRWCTVWALVEQGTYQIDDISRRSGWDTIDKVLHEDHFYSTKPPLLSTGVAGLYWLEKKTLGWTLDDDLSATVRLLLVLVNLLPWGAAAWLLSETVRRYAASNVTTLLITAIAAWGTLLTPFLVTLNNHLPAAICLIVALDAAMRITLDGDQRWWRYAICGFFAALTATCELPAAAFGLAIFLLLFRHSRVQSLTHFLPFAIAPLAAFFLTNALATGGFTPFYMFYGGDKYVFTHDGIPSYWSDPKGLDRSTDSTPAYLFHCTLGHHGILSLTPVLLVSILGWVLSLRGASRLKTYHLLGAGLTLLVLGYYLTRTSNYNYGGNTVALRWMLWLVPLWLIAMIPAIDQFGEARWFRATTALLLAASVFSAWYPMGSPWQSPWLFTWLQDRGWIDYRDPPPRFEHPVYSWLYLLPSGPQRGDYWTELASVDADGVTSVTRIEDRGPTMVSQRLARMVRITRRDGAGRTQGFDLTIDVEAFQAGAPIGSWLMLPMGQSSAADVRRYEKFLSGLPEPALFQPLSRVYRAARVRKDAFECLTASARVMQAPPSAEWEPRLFESRLILSPEAPFGILRYETYVYDASGRTLHAHERWAIHRAGTWLPRPAAAPQPVEPPPQAAAVWTATR